MNSHQHPSTHCQFTQVRNKKQNTVSPYRSSDLKSKVAHCTSLPYSISMVFIEAPIFSKYIYNYVDDEGYSALQQTLALRPDAGKIIPGSGGLRKLRWAGSGRGKRGGLRIIYYWLSEDGQIWLLTIYAKNEAENIPNSVLKLLRKEMEK